MSLLSLLNTATSSASYASTTSAALQKSIDAASASTANASTYAATSTGLTISKSAKIAAAEATDNKKEFAALSANVRATLDAQYAASSVKEPQFDEMSGRALAAIALNDSGNFSRNEVFAAKTELRERIREVFTDAIGQDVGLSGAVSYSKQLISNYDALSQEERTAIGWTEATRASAQSVIQLVNGTSGQTSLFQLLNGE